MAHDKELIPEKERWSRIFQEHDVFILKYQFPDSLPKRIRNRLGNFNLKEHLSAHPKDFEIAIVILPHFIIPVYNFLKRNKIDAKIVAWFHNSITMYIHSTSRIKSFTKKTIFNLLGVFKKQFKKVDLFLSISTGIAHAVIKQLPSAPVKVVYNPVLPANFENIPVIKQSSTPIFAYIGRLDDFQKNLRFMFKALSRLDFTWKLKIIGTGPDEQALMDYAKKLRIENSIEWKGFSEKPFELLRDEGVTALLLTSRFEGLPTVLIEAISYGIPVIASNCPTGPSDIVINGVNGYLYEPGNLKDFVEKLRGLATGDLKVADIDQMRKSIEKFRIDNVCANIYSSLVGLLYS